jgi:hypothetical protein
LGRHPGRGDSRAIQKRQANVRRLVPRVAVSGLPWNGSTSFRGPEANGDGPCGDWRGRRARRCTDPART